MNPIIYVIQNPIGQRYVGSTVNFSSRRHHHRRNLRKGQGVNGLLQASWNIHGPTQHTFQAVASVLDQAQMHLVERDVMRSLGSELNVNLDPSPVFLHPKNISPGRKKQERMSPLTVPYGPHESTRGFARDLGITHKAAKYYQKTYSYDSAIYKLAYTPKTVNRVMDHPPDPRKNNKLVNLGAGWESRAALKAQHGVTDRAYEKRVASGWSTSEALTLPLGTKRKPVKKRYITAAGQTRSMDDWEVLTGIKKNTMYARLAAGCTPEQAVGIEKTERQKLSEANSIRAATKPKRPTFTVNGFTGTIADIAVEFKVKESVVRGRQRMGWPEDAWVKPKVPRLPACVAARMVPTKKRKLTAEEEIELRAEYMELVGEFGEEV